MAIAARQIERQGFTVEDVLAMPDDGLRYELFDGMLIVNPPPTVPHQVAVVALLDLLRLDAPPGWRVLPAPVGWRPSATRWFEPDVVVVNLPHGPQGLTHLSEPPALVVEVLSPRTRAYDLSVKRQAYDEGGVEGYWVLDPSSEPPSVTVLERPGEGGHLVGVATATAREVARATRPWPVEIIPAQLVG